MLASPTQSQPLRRLPATLRTTLSDVWTFLRTRRGVVIAVLCLMPFGAGIASGLTGTIAAEWHVTPDELSAWIAASAVGTIAGAALAGWLSVRIGAWKTYLALGWATIVAIIALALAPRNPAPFLALEWLYRGLTGGCYASILALVMTAIGRGAVSTKAAVMWSLFNFAAVLPTMLEGRVHDTLGTTAMLLTDAGLGIAGLGILLALMRLIGFRFDALQSASIPLTPDNA
jgi:predicted MFS family arabinose efflux permease